MVKITVHPQALDCLKQKYDGVDVSEIEQVAKDSESKSMSARQDFIMALYYLERTSRFKESKRFKASTFEVYIRTVFGMSMQTYNKERMSFISFPKETVEYGVGVVSKVIRTCGAVKAVTAMKDIAKAKIATPEIVDNAIKKNAPKVERGQKKATVAELAQEIKRKDETIAKYEKLLADQDKIIVEQADQIRKLKNSLKRMRERLQEEAMA